jgi:hypothetical protein
MTALTLQPPDTPLDLPDFLRRLSSMMSGGRNAEMLARAADEIEALRRRAASTEERVLAQQDDHARERELPEAPEPASDNLVAEVAMLKAQLEATKQAAAIERSLFESDIHRLQIAAENAEERATNFAADMKVQIAELGAMAEARIAELTAEIEELRKPAPALDETIAVVPVEQLHLARAEFDHLAQGFAKSGDVISLTICQIGACAIDKALGTGTGETYPLPSASSHRI